MSYYGNQQCDVRQNCDIMNNTISRLEFTVNAVLLNTSQK